MTNHNIDVSFADLSGNLLMGIEVEHLTIRQETIDKGIECMQKIPTLNEFFIVATNDVRRKVNYHRLFINEDGYVDLDYSSYSEFLDVNLAALINQLIKMGEI